MDPVTASGGVSDRYASSQVAVLNRQSDQSTRTTGDVPGETAAKAGSTDAAVRVRRYDLFGEPVRGGLLVGPGDEVLDPVSHRRDGECPRARTGVMRTVGEQQISGRDHPLQNSNSVHHRGDGHPGNIPELAFGAVVAFLVPRRLVNGTSDQMPPRLPLAVRLGIRAASAAKAGHLPWAHSCQIGDDDEACRAQLARQRGAFVIVEGFPPWLAPSMPVTEVFRDRAQDAGRRPAASPVAWRSR